MVAGWIEKRVLIAVRTYPVPARHGIEVSCTGGITDDGQWIRLFPVPYRFLEKDQRFKKYQWVTVQCNKAKDDPRPESFKLNVDTIRIGDSVSAANDWRERRAIVRSLMRPSMCHIQREREAHGSPTLGIFKPAEIRRLTITATSANWTAQQLVNLQQVPLLQKGPRQLLEKLPFDFRYEFRCNDQSCGGHHMLCTDWEMGQAYRAWQRQYRARWQGVFRHRFEYEMIHKFDTHFFVGNIHQHPGSWIIVGLFYPPPPAMNDLFG